MTMEIRSIGRRYGSLIILMLFASMAMSQEIIPMPNSYIQSKGFFKIPKRLTISAADDFFYGLIQPFSVSIKRFIEIEIITSEKNGLIRLVRNPQIVEKEAYRLNVERRNITVEAGTTAGCFYGLQSLVQLLHNAGKSGQIACGEISDMPRYEWRGLMLDESRHFFGEQEVMKILDLMALLKLNGYTLETISEKNYYYDKVIQNNQFYRNKYVYNGMIYSIAPYHIYWPIPESAIQDNTLATLNQNFGYVGYENNIAPED